MLPPVESYRETGGDFELLFEANPLPMCVIKKDTWEFLTVNEAAVKMYGFSREEFAGISAAQLQAPGESTWFRDCCSSLEKHSPNASAACKEKGRHVSKDGNILFVETSLRPIRFRETDAVLLVIVDRSGTLQTEEQNREQASLLDLASDAILVCDLEGSVTYWNHGATKLYGWTAEEALGLSMVDTLMRDTSTLQATEAGVRETGEWTGELHQVTKDGRDIVVKSRWSVVSDSHGQPKALLVAGTDLTETRKLETQFLRAQRLDSIGTLASGVAHDLNNILSPILMSVGLLRRALKSPDQERMLGMIESSAERGAGIVKQVLTFARGVEGERVLLQPKHLLSEMTKILAQTFPKNIDIRNQFPANLWTVMGDATQLHQVLLNLCVNARDAMPKGGKLNITAENITVDQHFARTNPGAQLGDHVALCVTDSGMGMSPETMEKIFDPFFTTKEVGKGTGLGLATVIGIVKNHGGFLTLQSELGVGTTFRIFVPAKRDEAEVQETGGKEVDLRGKGELILVVDDEPSIRMALVQTLEEYGYRAYTAEDGTDALALYHQRRGGFKLVLTDINMGQMDGVELVRSLRKIDPQVRVIVSSGHRQPEQTTILDGLGVKLYLDKPYNAEKLLRGIREVLDAPAVRG